MSLRLSPELIARATDHALSAGEPRMVSLEGISGLPVEEILRALEHWSGMKALRMADLDAMTPDFDSIRFDECLRIGCVLALRDDGGRVFVSADPLDESLTNWASDRIFGDFEIAFAHPTELKSFLRKNEEAHGGLEKLAAIAPAQEGSRAPEEISLESIAGDQNQVVRFVNSTLYDAFRTGASDIHLENVADGLTVRYRVDGVLGTVRRLEQGLLAEQVVSRLKVMGELDIGERRIPQDGRISIGLDGRAIDFRLSIMPGLFGEDAVLRVLDRHAHTRDSANLSLGALGFEADAARAIHRLATLPYGMLLVTGPTGSGKTTTLYATLSELDHSQDKIVTIEDPVEYQLPGVLQIPVNEKKGLTFARGLRSILRHDPDRILVGEIRDRETAEIAVQAALTGHLVYTTVHANNAFDVISRFRHMQIDPYSLVTALNGVVAQRLIRKRCPHCAPEQIDTVAGCAHCRGTGYLGRMAIAEILVVSDNLREAILRQAPLSQLKEIARAQGTRLIREIAEDAVRRGMTTRREIDRVTFADA